MYSGIISLPVVKLADKLAGLLPKGLDKAMLLKTSGESNEAAVKLAKMYIGRFEVSLWLHLSVEWPELPMPLHIMRTERVIGLS